MPVIIVGAVLLLLLLIFGPAVWIKQVMARYSRPTDRYPGTGGELARHLLDQLGLQDVKVELTEQGDHYDPTSKSVRLAKGRFEGRSLTAVTVAAHEVGHAHQDAKGYGPLKWRTRLVSVAAPAQRAGAALMMAAPIVAIVFRAPVAGLLPIFGGFLILGFSVLTHIVTLPTEFDASFRRALPLLIEGEYLKPEDHGPARRILTAAAWTYVAASLMTLLDVGRWWAILRR